MCCAQRQAHQHLDIRDEIIKTALSLRGKVYKKNGKGPDGFDCSGFVYYVYKKSNVNLSPSTNKLIRYGHKITLEQYQAGRPSCFLRRKKYFTLALCLTMKSSSTVQHEKALQLTAWIRPTGGKSQSISGACGGYLLIVISAFMSYNIKKKQGAVLPKENTARK